MTNIDTSAAVREILVALIDAEMSLEDKGDNFAEIERGKRLCKKLLKELDGTYNG